MSAPIAEELDACATPRAGEVGEIQREGDTPYAWCVVDPNGHRHVSTDAEWTKRLYESLRTGTVTRFPLYRDPLPLLALLPALAGWVEAQRAFLAGEGGVARADAADAALLAAHAALVKP